MGERHVSVMIGAPPETVFGLYTDPGRARDWQSGGHRLPVAHAMLTGTGACPTARPRPPGLGAGGPNLPPGNRLGRPGTRS
jgi:hypothetical protein